ncbi:hypothetical protein B0H67DRAFT_599497 [Lasiosphaeris hirsuta]|uniref:FAD-binding PCMH-type domain-containing protein n=1 Tax=Lasiosphaeris hirsuta TaxID=260670 RepID=A0AA40AQ01_9PEZI|nr:hypothetical protein B0H67DRAFT_599497 [Lasiosphaeris hirsuta]
MKIAALAAGLFSVGVFAASSCKCFPGDDGWPSAIPLARVCHDSRLDSAACQNLQTKWQYPDPLIVCRIPCTLGNYNGAAVMVGAGVQGYEVLTAAKEKCLVVVTGECPTVGIASGYTQGGGHSVLSTNFGLSADNTLEFEIATAAGKLIVASRTQNSDLYWALSGDGPGNYGAVVSMKAKAFKDLTVGAATLSFFASNTHTHTHPEKFYAAIDAFHAAFPAMVQSGTTVVYYFTSIFFIIAPMTAYNKNTNQVKGITAPFVAKLNQLGVTHNIAYLQSATYYDHYDKYSGPLPTGAIQVGIAQYGGRLIPLATVQNTSPRRGLLGSVLAQMFLPLKKSNVNAVLPAWRKTLIHATLTTEWSFDPAKWEQMIESQQFMTETIMPELEAVTPGSGVYMNEANFQQPNF